MCHLGSAAGGLTVGNGGVAVAGEQEVELESIRKMLVRAADTGYSMWHNA